ncbi:MAG: hypothetical protein ACYS9X_12120 [Planctomycetota bacterium]
MEQLEAVRKGMRRAGREMVLSSSQALVRGALVLAGCGASVAFLGGPWLGFLGVWAGVVLLGALAEVVQYVRLARKSPGKFVTGIERQLLKFFLLVAAVGALLSAVLVRNGQADLLVGTWMLLVGMAYVAVGLFSFSRTWILGVCACVGGGVALFLEPAYSLIVAGLVLGFGSMVWAAVLRFTERGLE